VAMSSPLRESDTDVNSYFKENDTPEPKVRRLSFQDKQIRYVSSGLEPSDSTIAILFIHGAPGSSDSFYAYLADSTLRRQSHMITVDRLGYGYSDYGNAETDIQKQALPLAELINQTPAKDWLIVSHSYGCAIAGVLAIQQNSKIKANLMLCPVIDPNNEKMFYISSWPSKPVIKNLFSKAFQVASYEKMSHVEELEKIEGLWSQTEIPTTILHGAKDWIAPVENANYFKNFISDELLDVRIYPDLSHFIPWEQADLVINELVTLIEE